MYNIQRAYQEITRKAKAIIESEKESIIQSDSLNNLIDYYFSIEHIIPIEIDNSRNEAAVFKTDIKIPVEVISATIQNVINNKPDDFATECLVIQIPIKPNPTLNKIVEIQRYLDEKKEIRIQEENIQITVLTKGYRFKKNDEEVSAEAEKKKEIVYNWINSSCIQVNHFNEYLRSDIRQCLEKRKAEIQDNHERYNTISRKISVPISNKNDLITKVRIDYTPLVKRIKPNPKQDETYILDERKVLDIINIIDNQGRQFENTPSTYKTLGEEDLRNILLTNLNTVFEGKAVGEAFSSSGDTDIYLNIEKKSILIAECKIWRGEKAYESAIKQLLSYLTWGHSYGILITFCRIKGISKAIMDAKKVIPEFNTSNGQIKEFGESHFASHHQLPSDDLKYVQIHHLFYNLWIS